MPPYRLIVHGEVFDEFQRFTRFERERLLDIFRSLATYPHQSGDYRVTDSTGRPNEVKVFGSWCVTYWTDGLAKELRVVRVEKLRSPTSRRRRKRT